MVAALLADLFESHRPHLLSVGYRLTGSVTDAENAVTESWLRLATARQSGIEDLRAWLTARVAAICLDRLRDIAARQENTVAQPFTGLPEPIVTVPGASARDPLAAVPRNPDCRLAVMMALGTLAPSQRVALVLHDGFSVPFDEIAAILEIPVAAAQELATRARPTLAEVPEPIPAPAHGAAVRRLLDALYAGDEAAAEAALHPGAVYRSDSGNAPGAAPNVVVGAEEIIRVLRENIAYPAEATSTATEFVLVNGELGLLLPEHASWGGHPGSPERVIGFTVHDDAIRDAYDLADPAKLSGIRISR